MNFVTRKKLSSPISVARCILDVMKFNQFISGKFILNTFKMLFFLDGARTAHWPNDIHEVLIFVIKQDCSSSKAWKMIALHFVIAVKGVLVSVLSSLNSSQQSVLNSSKYISIPCVLLTADGNFVLLFFLVVLNIFYYNYLLTKIYEISLV